MNSPVPLRFLDVIREDNILLNIKSLQCMRSDVKIINSIRLHDPNEN